MQLPFFCGFLFDNMLAVTNYIDLTFSRLYSNLLQGLTYKMLSTLGTARCYQYTGVHINAGYPQVKKQAKMLVQQELSDFRPVCTAAYPSEVDVMICFCKMSMFENQQPSAVLAAIDWCVLTGGGPLVRTQ